MVKRITQSYATKQQTRSYLLACLLVPSTKTEKEGKSLLKNTQYM